jgi:hypothetical protein
VEFHRLDGIPNRILRRDRGLNRDRALHRSDCAGEVGDDALAGGVDPTRLEPGERADLAARHQPTVAGNVGGEDRGEFTLYRLNRRAWLLSI